ncbi:MAG: hypothetical protein V4813_09800 [Gemmatimonadota bacterium]
MRHSAPVTRLIALSFVALALIPVTLESQRLAPVPVGFVAAEPDINPVGVFTMKTTQPLMGSPVFDVNCTVTKGATGAFGGACGNADSGEVPISTVTAAGKLVTITGDTPVGPFTVTVTVTDGVAEGSISLGNETAKLKGTFAPK